MNDDAPNTEPAREQECPGCGGKGWWHDYCDRCYATGEHCGCGGQQRPCETCSGTGALAARGVPA